MYRLVPLKRRGKHFGDLWGKEEKREKKKKKVGGKQLGILLLGMIYKSTGLKVRKGSVRKKKKKEKMREKGGRE